MQIHGTQLRHQVRFNFRDEKHRNYYSEPEFIETRLIRDLKQFPKIAVGIEIADVVEVKRITGDVTYTRAFNKVWFHLKHSSYDAMTVRDMHDLDEIDVHPDLRGRVWVLGGGSSVWEQLEPDGQAWIAKCYREIPRVHVA